jgi:thiosulfate/3-mercaptopyruvate sulfurtransferase
MSRSRSSLISADELREQLDHVRVLDVRWYLDDHTKGRRNYEAGHVPGAVFVDLEQDITGRAEGAGRHPLPSVSAFERAMRRAGVGRGTRVVVYDDAGGSVAARVWWLLRIHGHDDAAVLDGGLQSWGDDLETGTNLYEEGDFVADEPDLSDVLTYDEVAKLGDGSVLIDVRAPERYRGELEPVDPIAGHVPGAKNAFWQSFLMDDGKIASGGELRARFGKLGVHEGNAVVYCGSGVVATQTLLALEEAGLGPVRIYAGGWSDWSNREGAEIATGEQ